MKNSIIFLTLIFGLGFTLAYADVRYSKRDDGAVIVTEIKIVEDKEIKEQIRSLRTEKSGLQSRIQEINNKIFDLQNIDAVVIPASGLNWDDVEAFR